MVARNLICQQISIGNAFLVCVAGVKSSTPSGGETHCAAEVLCKWWRKSDIMESDKGCWACHISIMRDELQFPHVWASS